MKKIIEFVLVSTVLLFASGANALVVTESFSGNDCSGYFGKGFDSCQIFVNKDGTRIELSPVIAKFDQSLLISETNGTVFPSIDGSEWGFSNTGTNNNSGDWLYTAGVNDPGIRYWAEKSANQFTLFWDVDIALTVAGGVCDGTNNYTLACLDAANFVTSGSWATAAGKDLSHLTFYDSAPPTTVPEPGMVGLLAIGLIGVVAARRKMKV